MSRITCWSPVSDSEMDQEFWGQIEPPDCLTEDGGSIVLRLPSGRHGFVDGLPVIGGIQKVAVDSLIRVWGEDGSELQFVVRHIGATAEPGRNRPCQFCGLPITDEALRCVCGRLYCSHFRESYAECPICGQRFDADAPPPEELL